MSEQTARELLMWEDRLPEAISAVNTTPEGHATETFSVVADYGWASRILSSGSYERDAEAVAQALREAIAVRE